jgi:transcriptional antiterminator NusG
MGEVVKTLPRQGTAELCPKSKAVYCLYCKTGRERSVKDSLEKLNLRVIPALAVQNVTHNGVTTKEKRLLLPGYVLFESEDPLDDNAWERICEHKHIYRPIRYLNGTRELMGADLAFVKLLIHMKGRLGVSEAVEVKTRVILKSGPLKKLTKFIKKVNRSRKCALVELESISVSHGIWLSYEVVAGRNKNNFEPCIGLKNNILAAGNRPQRRIAYER